MIRNSWRTQLKAAAHEKDVLAVVRGFLSEWSREEIAALPVQAWPTAIASGADVLAHAALLAGLHARFDGDASGLPGLQELLLFFTHAAVRIARLASATEAADPPPKRVRTTAARKRRSNGRRAGSVRRR